jgi:hypothetical protein
MILFQIFIAGRITSTDWRYQIKQLFLPDLPVGYS